MIVEIDFSIDKKRHALMCEVDGLQGFHAKGKLWVHQRDEIGLLN